MTDPLLTIEDATREFRVRASSEVLLRAPYAGSVVEGYDRRSPTDGDASEVASPPRGTPEVTTPSRATAPNGQTGPSTSADVDGSGDALTSVAGPADDAVTPGEVRVDAGESFRAIAEDRVAAELGAVASAATVTAYWSALVRAKADRLVEPGNPDLLHVGQAVLVPPLA
jgi:hypothetical protein